MQTGIGDHVLNRFSRIVLVVRPIIMMVVRVSRPMQHGVSQILHLSECPARRRHGHGLPKQREQNEDGGNPATHGRQFIGSA